MALKAVHGRMLEDYVAVVRRRWLVVVVCVALTLGAGFAYLQLASKTYVSSAKVLVQRTSADPVAEGSRTTDAVNLDTEAQLVKSIPVAQRAERVLETDLLPVQLARRVTVTVPPNTTVLQITYAASSPEKARAGAQAFAEAYLEFRGDAALKSVGEQVDNLNAQIAALQTQIDDISGQLATADDASKPVLQAQRDSLTARLSSLGSEVSSLQGASVTPGQVINEAQLPRQPRDPNPMLVLPSALFLGLLLGLSMALWRERVDQRIHSVSEIDRLFGLTPLADLKVTIGVGAGRDSRHYDVRALYHSLRANGPDAAEVVLVVAPDSLSIANGVSRALGVVAARSGATTTYLSSESDPDAAAVRQQSSGGVLRTLHYHDVDLVHDGEINAERLQAQIRGLRADNDFVVLGLPSNDPNVDLPMLSRHVDVVLVLVHLGQATRSSVGDTLRALKNSGARTVFAVSVDLRRRGRASRNTPVLDDGGVIEEPDRVRPPAPPNSKAPTPAGTGSAPVKRSANGSGGSKRPPARNTPARSR